MRQLFGGLFLAIGILLIAVSGLCSAVIIVGSFSEAVREPSLLFLPLIVGGVPLAVGFGLFKWGQALLRQVEPRE